MTTALVERNDTALDFALTPAEAKRRFAEFNTFVLEQMKEGVDFGTIPGTNKPTLLKPGAEKLGNLYGLAPVQEVTKRIEDWDRGFFFYEVKTTLTRISTGDVVAEGLGSCNSKESRYRWRWVAEEKIPKGVSKNDLETRSSKVTEFTFAVDKAETTGQYGKPAAYWKQFTDAIENGAARKVKRQTAAGKQLDAWEIGSTLYRVENDDIYDQVNTILKMGAKRSLVDAMLKATRASGIFTQDLEDLHDDGAITTTATIVEPEVEPDHFVQQGPIAEPPTNLIQQPAPGSTLQRPAPMPPRQTVRPPQPREEGPPSDSATRFWVVARKHGEVWWQPILQREFSSTSFEALDADEQTRAAELVEAEDAKG